MKLFYMCVQNGYASRNLLMIYLSGLYRQSFTCYVSRHSIGGARLTTFTLPNEVTGCLPVGKSHTSVWVCFLKKI